MSPTTQWSKTKRMVRGERRDVGDALVLPQVLPYRLQVYFLKLRAGSSATAEDGVLLGHHLMVRSKAPPELTR